VGDRVPPLRVLLIRQAITTSDVRPLTCANRPPVPSRSTSPVSNRSTHIFTPVDASISFLPFPPAGFVDAKDSHRRRTGGQY